MNQSKKQDIVAEEDPKKYFLGMNSDCWEYIFDHLSLKDIVSMGQTCNVMKEMADFYIREYKLQYIFEPTQSDYLDSCQFITIMNINHESIQFLLKHNNKTFDSLKTFIFKLRTEYDIWHMQDVLKNIEIIKLRSSIIMDNTFKLFANHCPKLRNLKIQKCRLANIDGTFFLQNYPELVRLTYRPLKSNVQIPNFRIFLENHSKLKQFHTDFNVLWTNRNLLEQTSVQLDSLKIYFEKLDIENLDQFVNLFTTLHERGFYKTLQLKFLEKFFIASEQLKEHYNNAISLLPALTQISVEPYSDIDLTRLPNLEKLKTKFVISAAEAKKVAESLQNLRLLDIREQPSDVLAKITLEYFIGNSKKLKTIKLSSMQNNVLNLVKLNKERERVENACQVTICVPENVYLAEKWKTQNAKLELVKIGRLP